MIITMTELALTVETMTDEFISRISTLGVLNRDDGVVFTHQGEKLRPLAASQGPHGRIEFTKQDGSVIITTVVGGSYEIRPNGEQHELEESIMVSFTERGRELLFTTVKDSDFWVTVPPLISYARPVQYYIRALKGPMLVRVGESAPRFLGGGDAIKILAPKEAGSDWRYRSGTFNERDLAITVERALWEKAVAETLCLDEREYLIMMSQFTAIQKIDLVTPYPGTLVRIGGVTGAPGIIVGLADESIQMQYVNPTTKVIVLRTDKDGYTTTSELSLSFLWADKGI